MADRPPNPFALAGEAHKLRPTEMRVRGRDGSVSIQRVSGETLSVVSGDKPFELEPMAPRAWPLRPARYSSDRKAWVPESGGSHAYAASASACADPSFTLLTLNVWFDTGTAFNERLRACFDFLAETLPTFICLQEVLPQFLSALRDEPWAQAHYSISDAEGLSLGTYGVLLLSRLPAVESWQLPLPSTMGRSLVASRFAFSRGLVTLGTVHLESMPVSAPVRAEQLALIVPSLCSLPASASSSSVALLAGDLNFGDGPEQDALPTLAPGFSDAWLALRSGEAGFTYDTTRNVMMEHDEHERYDHVLFRPAPAGHCSVRRVSIVADSPIAGASCGGRPVFISDHFCLLSEFQFSDL
eukprot:c9041_g1_i2.p1 GENE.c9041_g1_i2~~c9041_g1_i2.p1  ORF type:complete len:371 (+),score=42.83 c9041_g1_i2:47-1114(+)